MHMTRFGNAFQRLYERHQPRIIAVDLYQRSAKRLDDFKTQHIQFPRSNFPPLSKLAPTFLLHVARNESSCGMMTVAVVARGVVGSLMLNKAGVASTFGHASECVPEDGAHDNETRYHAGGDFYPYGHVERSPISKTI